MRIKRVENAVKTLLLLAQLVRVVGSCFMFVLLMTKHTVQGIF